MPSGYLKSLSKGDRKKLKKLEKIWQRAKGAARKSYGKPTKATAAKFWGTTTKIFKNMAHLNEQDTKQFINYIKEKTLAKKQNLTEMAGGSANVSGNIAKTDKPLFSPKDYAKQEKEHAQQSEEIKRELGVKKKKKKTLKEDGSGAGGGSSGAMGGSFSGAMGAEGAQAAQDSGYVGNLSGMTARMGSAMGTTSRIKFKKKKRKHMKEEKEVSSEEQKQELDVDARQDKEIDDMLAGKVAPTNDDAEDTDAKQDKEIDAELSGKQPTSKKPKTAPVKPVKFDKGLKDSKTNANAPDTADSAEIDVLNASNKQEFSGYKLLKEDFQLPGKDAGEAEHNWDEYENNFGPKAEVIKLPIVDIKLLSIDDKEVEEEPLEGELESQEGNPLKVVEIPDEVTEHPEKVDESDLKIEALQKQIDELKAILGKKTNDEYPREDAEQDKHFKEDIDAGFSVKEVTGKDGKKNWEIVGKKTNYTYQSAADEKAANFWLEKLNSANKNPGAVKQDLQAAKEKGPEVGNKIAQSKTPEEKQKMLAASFSKLHTNKKLLLASATQLINKVATINEKLAPVKLKAKILYVSEQTINEKGWMSTLGKKAVLNNPHKAISAFLKEKKNKFVRNVKNYINELEEGYALFANKNIITKDFFEKIEQKNDQITKSFNSLAYFFEAAFLDEYKKDVEEVDDLENTLDSNKNIISSAKENKKDMPDVKETNPLNATCPTCGSIAIGKDKQHSADACAWCINGHKWNVQSGSVCGEVDIPADYRNVIYKDGMFVDKEEAVLDNEEKITDEDIKKSEEQSAAPQKIEPPTTEPIPVEKTISAPENSDQSEEIKSEPEESSEEVKSEEPTSEEVKSEEPEQSEESESEEKVKSESEESESEEVKSESESEEK